MEARSGGDRLNPAPPGQAAITSRPRPTSTTAITSRSRRSPVASGTSFTSAGRPARARPVGRPEGRDRHPGVGTPAGRRRLTAGSATARAVSSTPMTDVDPTRRIPPADQPARLDALEAAVRARTDLVPGGRHRPRVRPGCLRGRDRGRDGHPPPRAAGLAAGDRARPRRAGMLLGRLAGVPVVVLQGRFHLYEGYDPGLVIQPVLLFQRLGRPPRACSRTRPAASTRRTAPGR